MTPQFSACGPERRSGTPVAAQTFAADKFVRLAVDVPSVVAADLFGAEHSRICEIELPLTSQRASRRCHGETSRAIPSPLHYGRLTRDGKRVPLVRVSGRWLEAFGFKEGAKFTAVGVEGGLLVLTVYEAAPDGRTSPRDTLRAIDAQDDALPPAIFRDLLAPLFALRSAPC